MPIPPASTPLEAATRAVRALAFVALPAIGANLSCGTEDVELSRGVAPGSAGGAGLDATPDVTGTARPPGESPESGEPAEGRRKGCEKVDFLFVVDNSFSMRQEQENLARSFPGFMNVVESTLAARDYHVMAVDTDASGGLAGLLSLAAAEQGALDCQPAPACCRQACRLGAIPFAFPSVDTCNGRTCDEVLSAPDDACEGTLGAGKRLSPRGEECGVVPPLRYLADGQPALSETFSCAAQVGTFGDGDEEPMGAMMEALSPSLNAEGGCNQGFLRDDAILVATFITDEEDEDSPGNPTVWRQALLDSKAGNEEAVVVLGLLGDGNVPGGLPGGPCDGDADAAPNLQEFATSFSFGSLGSVCAPDYAPFFELAVSVIDAACDEFVPPIIR